MQNYTLSILVENASGVLSQVTRLFSRKGYNINSLAVGKTHDPEISRITVIVPGDELMVKLLTTQLNKMLCVLSVQVLSDGKSVERELILIKVKAADRTVRDEIIQIVNIFRANIIDIGLESLTISQVGDLEKTDAMLNLMEQFGILETVRTGMIALERGANSIYDRNKDKEEYNYGKNVL